MKAVAYTHCHPVTHEDALEDIVVRDPSEPRGHDLLVEVRAVSVNPVDAKQRAGADPAGEPRILGFDAAGVIVARGPDAHIFGNGEEVFYAGAINRPGSNAQFQLVDERIVGRKPRTLGFAEAASMPLTAITAWEALFDRLRIARGAAGGALLVIGGAGGVGSMAIQLARRLTKLTVVTTASRPETRAWCEELGAHHVLDHSGDLAAQAKSLGLGFPWIFSATQTVKHWRAICEMVAPQGAVCAIDDFMSIDIGRLKSKAASFHWEAMFARAIYGTPDLIAQHHLLNELADLVDAGTIRHAMKRHLGRIVAANLLEGHALVESGAMIGKAVAEGWD
ncbi:zinc-binding alcohol dehydrogenase family protein [Roseococcus sp. SYP-B2431]|uniref:zinc-binding alcohol dehydrogenase family protein n=1 Tax=Roseococcus sp. SYP-B2431 TaxID=2496640 RepID=UPI001039D5EB|nr:zinc-binding alcohol dehydrogenase family protein [Roseococcus sp. SYP-B2431]TCH97935.1 zinc-binding alcohol dehydrogenase family protein [Roseococcus sp. SYP-B2431]